MLHPLGQKKWDFCKVKSSRLLTYVSYVVGPYMLCIKFEENYEVIFGEKIIYLSFKEHRMGFYSRRTQWMGMAKMTASATRAGLSTHFLQTYSKAQL